MSDKQLQVRIKLNADGLVTGLKGSAKAVEEAMTNMRSQFKVAKSSATDAVEGVGSLSATLREFKAEATSNSRLARFLANDLAEIVPGADAASTAIKGLARVGLEGLSIGGAIAAAGLAVQYFSSQIEQARAVTLAARDGFRDAFQTATSGLLGVQKGLQGEASKTDETWEKTVETVMSKVAKLKQEIRDLEENPSAARQLASGATGGLVAPDDVDKIRQKNAEIDGLEKGLQDARKVREVTAADERDRANANIAERTKVLEASTADEITRINVAKEARLSEIRNGRALDVDQKAKLELATERDAAEQIAQLKATREIQFQEQALGIEATLMTSRERITEEGELRINKLKLQYRKRTSDDDKEQLALLIQLEQDRTARLLELDEAAGQKSLAQALSTADAIKSARIEELAREAQEVGKIEDEGNGTRLQKAVAAINQRAAEEIAIVRRAAADHVITAQQMANDINAITARAAKERADAVKEENKKEQESALATAKQIGGALGGSFADIITGAKSASQAVKQMADGMIRDAVRLATEWVAQEIVKVSGMAAADASAGAAKRASNLTIVTSDAGAAGAEAAMSNPLMFVPGGQGAAIAYGAGIAAAFEGAFGSLASAAGGFDIGATINPITQLHAREMVLPAHIAQPLRESISSGSLGGGASGGGGSEIHIHATDAAGFDRVVRNNVGTLIRAARRVQKNGRTR